jgi:hypothetical protein
MQDHRVGRPCISPSWKCFRANRPSDDVETMQGDLNLHDVHVSFFTPSTYEIDLMLRWWPSEHPLQGFQVVRHGLVRLAIGVVFVQHRGAVWLTKLALGVYVVAVVPCWFRSRSSDRGSVSVRSRALALEVPWECGAYREPRCGSPSGQLADRSCFVACCADWRSWNGLWLHDHPLHRRRPSNGTWVFRLLIFLPADGARWLRRCSHPRLVIAVRPCNTSISSWQRPVSLLLLEACCWLERDCCWLEAAAGWRPLLLLEGLLLAGGAAAGWRGCWARCWALLLAGGGLWWWLEALLLAGASTAPGLHVRRPCADVSTSHLGDHEQGGAMQPRCHPWSQPSGGPCSQHLRRGTCHATSSSSSSPAGVATPDEVATPPDGWLPPAEWRRRRSCRDPTHISSLVTEGPAFPHTPSHVKQRHISSLVNGTCLLAMKQRHISKVTQGPAFLYLTNVTSATCHVKKT